MWYGVGKFVVLVLGPNLCLIIDFFFFLLHSCSSAENRIFFSKKRMIFDFGIIKFDVLCAD